MSPNSTLHRRLKLSVYATATWAFLFAGLSFYWALGGRIGAETLGEAFADPALMADPVFVGFIWATAFLKLVSGVLVLALVQSWEGFLLRRIARIVILSTGVLLILYGVALIVQHSLMVIGSTEIPAALESMVSVYWHLFLWDPYWLLGGVLFVTSERLAKRYYK